MRVDAARGLRDVARTEAVDQQCALGVALAPVDIGPRGGMHDRVRLDARDRGEHRFAVGDVEGGVVGAHDVVIREGGDQLVADLASRARDEDLHQCSPARYRSTGAAA